MASNDLMRTLWQIARTPTDVRVKELERDAEARARREAEWPAKPCANQFCIGSVSASSPDGTVCAMCVRCGPPEVRHAEY